MVRKYTILHGIFEEKYIIDILKKKIVKTRDGSNTIFVPEFEETYHSTHGAIQESLHVFVSSGLKFKTELNRIVGREDGARRLILPTPCDYCPLLVYLDFENR